MEKEGVKGEEEEKRKIGPEPMMGERVSMAENDDEPRHWGHLKLSVLGSGYEGGPQ